MLTPGTCAGVWGEAVPCLSPSRTLCCRGTQAQGQCTAALLPLLPCTRLCLGVWQERGASPAVLGAPCCPGAVQGRCWHWGAGRVTGCACVTLLDYEQQLALRSCSNRNQVCSRTFWAGSRDSGRFVWNLLLSTHQARGCDTSQEAVTWVLVAVGCGVVLTLTPLLELSEPSEDACEGHS